MSVLSVRNLGCVALGVTLIGTGSLYVARWQLQSKLRESASYKEAMECLRKNTNTVEFLGEPIRERSVDVGDNNCYGNNGDLIWVTVPIEAKKHNANLRYWVTVTDRERGLFRVPKVELEIKGSKTKILLKDDKIATQADTFTPA